MSDLAHVVFQDPVCQYPGCRKATAGYVNPNMAAAATVYSGGRMEARCEEHGGRLLGVFMFGAAGEEVELKEKIVEAAIAWRDVASGKLTVPPWAYMDVERALADAVDALQAAREG